MERRLSKLEEKRIWRELFEITEEYCCSVTEVSGRLVDAAKSDVLMLLDCRLTGINCSTDGKFQVWAFFDGSIVIEKVEVPFSVWTKEQIQFLNSCVQQSNYDIPNDLSIGSGEFSIRKTLQYDYRECSVLVAQMDAIATAYVRKFGDASYRERIGA